jgi:hypothetical protein
VTWGDIDAFIEKASLADGMGTILTMRGLYEKKASERELAKTK